jgi:hypothetical protein
MGHASTIEQSAHRLGFKRSSGDANERSRAFHVKRSGPAAGYSRELIGGFWNESRLVRSTTVGRGGEALHHGRLLVLAALPALGQSVRP